MGRRVGALMAASAAVFLILAAGLPDRSAVNAIGYAPSGLPIAPEVDAVAPPLSVQNLDGSTFALPVGQPAVINFWATWCGPCLTEIPLLGALAERYQGRGLQVVGVNMGESAAVVRAWVAALPTLPRLRFVLDPGQVTFASYRVRGAPSTFFIGRDGVIQQITYGPLDASASVAVIEALLR